MPGRHECAFDVGSYRTHLRDKCLRGFLSEIVAAFDAAVGEQAWAVPRRIDDVVLIQRLALPVRA
jgi:hypothetical protein